MHNLSALGCNYILSLLIIYDKFESKFTLSLTLESVQNKIQNSKSIEIIMLSRIETYRKYVFWLYV